MISVVGQYQARLTAYIIHTFNALICLGGAAICFTKPRKIGIGIGLAFMGLGGFNSLLFHQEVRRRDQSLLDRANLLSWAVACHGNKEVPEVISLYDNGSTAVRFLAKEQRFSINLPTESLYRRCWAKWWLNDLDADHITNCEFWSLCDEKGLFGTQKRQY
ncbi:MAG: hypothetical protein ACYCOU_04310 [Sulfobacillus sp.]